MIVKIEDSYYLVLGYDSCNRWYCFETNASRLRRFLPNKINIRNPKIPKDWRVTIYHDWSEVPPEVDYGDYVDHIFFCHPESINPCHLLELSALYLSEDTLDSFAYYELLKAMNEIRKFHGLEKIEIPYVEEYELELMTPEQRRQKAINDEFDEYLRIGEELSKAKDSGEKSLEDDKV